MFKILFYTTVHSLMMGQRGFLIHVNWTNLKKITLILAIDRVQFLFYALVTDQRNFASTCSVE